MASIFAAMVGSHLPERLEREYNLSLITTALSVVYSVNCINGDTVGTILDRADAKDALKLGAKFLMSPAMVKGILDDVAEGQALYIPGATTPTEARDNRTNIRERGTSALFILEYDVVSEMILNGKELEYKWDSDLSQLFLLKELDSSLRDEKDHCLEETE
ncbi:hypothetical protein CASFOL_001417 [Castilleja foliolosa]|uniref:Uncharacterized protein n=1 Tax=Castilleja foliolosa TaxID=1961234 RepID=A0ABD3ELP9_9LAMI